MIPLEHADVFTDVQALGKLRTAASRQSPEALEKVAEQFEAVFLQTMLKTMRQASLGDGIMDSDQTKFYQEMFDQQISMDLAKRRQGGVAEMLIRQLGGPQAEQSKAPNELNHDRLHQRIQATNGALQAFAPPDSTQEKIKGFDSPEDFVAKMWPLAQEAASQLGVKPETLLAQSALETGWGASVTRFSNGVSTNNLFNIKADQRWNGPRAVVSTLEYEAGLPVQQKAAFRAYDTFEESFKDYVDFLKSSPRYSDALDKAADSDSFIQGLHEAGYATDPEYSNKINRISSGELLREAVNRVKEPVAGPIT